LERSDAPRTTRRSPCRHHHHAQAAKEVACGNDPTKTHSMRWIEATYSGSLEYLTSGKTAWTGIAGIRLLGMKIQGADSRRHPGRFGVRKSNRSFSSLPQVRSVFAERVSKAFTVNIEVLREEASRYGTHRLPMSTIRHFRNRRRNGGREQQGRGATLSTSAYS